MSPNVSRLHRAPMYRRDPEQSLSRIIAQAHKKVNILPLFAVPDLVDPHYCKPVKSTTEPPLRDRAVYARKSLKRLELMRVLVLCFPAVL